MEFVARIEKEISELNEKISKIVSFMQSGKSNDLKEYEDYLLTLQLKKMTEYRDILQARLSIYK